MCHFSQKGTMFWFFLSLSFFFDYSTCITNLETKAKNDVLDNSKIVVSLENYNVSNSDGESVDSFYTLPPNSSSVVVVSKIPADVHFVVMQVHSYLVDVILSLDEMVVPSNSITGTNVGLVKIYGETDLTFHVVYNSSSDEADIMVTVQAYSKEAPMPGGCNMEFQVEVSPFLLTNYSETMTEVSFAPSAPPLMLTQSLQTANDACNIKPSPVQYKMYHQYFPERDFTKETYFRVLRSMMTKGRILEKGVRVPEKLSGSPAKRFFASYPGTGNAFVVISQFENQTSVYVPSFTYGCSDLKSNNTCKVLTTTFSKLLCATILFLGLFACYFGHFFFRVETFLFGYLASGIITYILVSILYKSEIALPASVSMGLFIAVIMLLAWKIFGLPIVSLSLTTLTSGFLLASIIYYPLIDYVDLFFLDINFWGAFIGIVMSCPFLMVCLAEKANIISCAFVWSYIAIVSIDHYIGSNLRYIVINTIRRAVHGDFNLAVIAPPFQWKDLLVCLIWLFLMLTGIKTQRLLARFKPPYPPPTHPFRDILRLMGDALPRTYQTNERAPLLGEPQPDSRPDTLCMPRRQPSYYSGTVKHDLNQ